MSKRDDELRELFDKINKAKERVEKKKADLREQITFLENEKGEREKSLVVIA